MAIARSFHMSWTRITDLNNLIRHAVLTIRRTCIDAMNVVNAPADGILFYDAHAHDDCGILGFLAR